MKETISAIIQKWPWLAEVMSYLYGGTRPRYALGVMGVIQNKDGAVLIVQHVLHGAHPWGLPGGWMEAREAPEAAIAREIREETGLEIEVGQPLMISPEKYPWSMVIVFHCTVGERDPVLSFEINDHDWIYSANDPRLSKRDREILTTFYNA